MNVAGRVADSVVYQSVLASFAATLGRWQDAVFSIVVALVVLTLRLAHLVVDHVVTASRSALFGRTVSAVPVATLDLAFGVADSVVHFSFRASLGTFHGWLSVVVAVLPVILALRNIANFVASSIVDHSGSAARSTVHWIGRTILSVIGAGCVTASSIAMTVVDHVHCTSLTALLRRRNQAVFSVVVAGVVVTFFIADSVIDHASCASFTALWARNTVCAIVITSFVVAGFLASTVIDVRLFASRTALYR